MMGDDTQEFMIQQAIDKRLHERPRSRRFDRRSAYLFIWGNVYGVFGVMLMFATRRYGLDNLVFSVAFMFSAVVAVMASLTERDRLDVTAFTLLAGAAAAESFWSFIDPDREPLLSVLGGILWLGVASAQVVVAGWPLGYGPASSTGRGLRERFRRVFAFRP